MKVQRVIVEITSDSNLSIEFDPPAASDEAFASMPDDEKTLQHQAARVFEAVMNEFGSI
jgi:hypothetical protein